MNRRTIHLFVLASKNKCAFETEQKLPRLIRITKILTKRTSKQSILRTKQASKTMEMNDSSAENRVEHDIVAVGQREGTKGLWNIYLV